MDETKIFEHFKFTLPIIKTRVEIEKVDGKDKEVKYVEGVASSTDLDLHGDRMDPSAIKTMAESLKYHIIKLNAEHDTSWQSELGDIAKLDVSEDNKLLLEAKLNEMSKANDLWYAITDLNKKLGLSIGGYVKEYEMVKEEFKNEESGEMETKWVRHYKNIQLDHIAVTSSPANPKTWVGAIAKSIEKDSQTLIKKIENESKKELEKSEEISKPYPHEHACRLKSPDDFEKGSFRSMERDHNGKKYRVIVGRPKGKDTTEEQAYRYNKDSWSADEARNHCQSHKGSFEAAKPTKKSIEDIEKDKKNKVLKELARQVVRTVQNLEADLLLELTEKALKYFITDEQLLILQKMFPMENKNSLEADKSLKKDETTTKPEGEVVETPATPENEPKEDNKKDAPVKPEDGAEEAKPTEGETEKATPKDGDECMLPSGEKGQIKDGKCTAVGKSEDKPKDAGDTTAKESEEKKEPEVKSEEKSEEKKPEEPLKEKKAEDETANLLKTVAEQVKQVVSTNEALIKRIEELEKQPAGRKTVEEIDKGIGDDDKPVIDAKTLKKELDQKVADLRKSHAGSPNLFAEIQKLRAEYSQKIQSQ